MGEHVVRSIYGTCVSFTASGVNLVTFYPSGHYALVSGTSFSSAIVSGLAALAGSLAHSPGQVNSVMVRGAVDIRNQNPSYKNKIGKGRVDSKRSLQALTH
jgi:subtilisin family serine protease